MTMIRIHRHIIKNSRQLTNLCESRLNYFIINYHKYSFYKMTTYYIREYSIEIGPLPKSHLYRHSHYIFGGGHIKPLYFYSTQLNNIIFEQFDGNCYLDYSPKQIKYHDCINSSTQIINKSYTQLKIFTRKISVVLYQVNISYILEKYSKASKLDIL